MTGFYFQKRGLRGWITRTLKTVKNLLKMSWKCHNGKICNGPKNRLHFLNAKYSYNKQSFDFRVNLMFLNVIHTRMVWLASKRKAGSRLACLIARKYHTVHMQTCSLLKIRVFRVCYCKTPNFLSLHFYQYLSFSFCLSLLLHITDWLTHVILVLTLC